MSFRTAQTGLCKFWWVRSSLIVRTDSSQIYSRLSIQLLIPKCNSVLLQVWRGGTPQSGRTCTVRSEACAEFSDDLYSRYCQILFSRLLFDPPPHREEKSMHRHRGNPPFVGSEASMVKTLSGPMVNSPFPLLSQADGIHYSFFALRPLSGDTREDGRHSGVVCIYIYPLFHYIIYSENLL